jgi:hydrogenase expression/formation protein HypE
MTMTPLGKITPDEFERTIARQLGAKREEVIVGPGIGRDSAVIRIGAGRVMAVTTDPLSLIPAFGAADSARLACHLLASDLWASGIPPAYASVSFALPPQFPDAEFEAYWAAMSDEFAQLGIAVVTGHTGRYAGCDLTIIGAATLIGVGDEGRTVGPQYVQPGDRVLMTKDCAFEATAVAARMFPKRLAATLDEEQMARAIAKSKQVSVVADCRAALRVGVRDRGVTALHDATEGGVLGGLLELAKASVVDLRVARASMLLSDESRAACALMGLDPLWTLSEGTLLLTVRAKWALEVEAQLADEGIAVAEIGEVVRGNGCVWLTGADHEVTRVTEAQPDGYWAAYDRAVREGWS